MPTRKPRIEPQVPLREVRKAYGLTLKDLADRIEQHYSKRPTEAGLANIELGHQLGSAALMTAWARALKISPLDVRQDGELLEVLSANGNTRNGAAA
jgi:transcriptional regulator with XRE-family HTH domain